MKLNDRALLHIRGSDGHLTCDFVTGEVLDRSGDPHNAYGDIGRFDTNRVSTPYNPRPDTDFDVLYMGHWKTDGTYEEPAEFEREYNSVWECLKPRSINPAPTKK